MSNQLNLKPTSTTQPDSFIAIIGGAVKRLTWAGFAALLNALYVPLTRTINGHALSADVTITKTDVGLGNVSNLAPADLPISTATQTALDLKANLADLVGLLDLKASVDASTNPNYPAALKGDARFISAAGKVGGSAGKVVEVGDVMIATVDNAGGTEASVGTSWTVIQSNIMGITAYGMALIQAADYAAMRTLLSLVAGTNFNSYRAEVDKLGVQGSDIASASSIDLGAATGDYVNITGTTSITTLGTVAAGTRRKVKFAGILTLTYNATSLILPTAANITTAANDVAEFISMGSGNWRCTGYLRANGKALSFPVAGTDFNSYRAEVDKLGVQGSDIASASSIDLGAATGDYVNITGTTSITALGTVAAGTRRKVKFAGILTLTYNSTSLILPTAANITTAANDVAEFISMGSGNWRCTGYQRANGRALSFPLAGTDFNSYRAEIDLLSVKGTNVASAANINIETVTGDFIDITGTTSISGFYTVGGAGKQRVLRFKGVLTLTHDGSTLILPGAANITTAVNDVAIFRSVGSNAWQCISYMRADGTPLVAVGSSLVRVGGTLQANNIPGTSAQCFLTFTYYDGTYWALRIGGTDYVQTPSAVGAAPGSLALPDGWTYDFGSASITHTDPGVQNVAEITTVEGTAFNLDFTGYAGGAWTLLLDGYGFNQDASTPNTAPSTLNLSDNWTIVNITGNVIKIASATTQTVSASQEMVPPGAVGFTDGDGTSVGAQMQIDFATYNGTAWVLNLDGTDYPQAPSAASTAPVSPNLPSGWVLNSGTAPALLIRTADYSSGHSGAISAASSTISVSSVTVNPPSIFGDGIEGADPSGATIEAIIAGGVAGKKVKLVKASLNGNIGGSVQAQLYLRSPSNVDTAVSNTPDASAAEDFKAVRDGLNAWYDGIDAGEYLVAKLVGGTMPADSSTCLVRAILEQS